MVLAARVRESLLDVDGDLDSLESLASRADLLVRRDVGPPNLGEHDGHGRSGGGVVGGGPDELIDLLFVRLHPFGGHVDGVVVRVHPRAVLPDVVELVTSGRDVHVARRVGVEFRFARDVLEVAIDGVVVDVLHPLVALFRAVVDPKEERVEVDVAAFVVAADGELEDDVVTGSDRDLGGADEPVDRQRLHADVVVVVVLPRREPTTVVVEVLVFGGLLGRGGVGVGGLGVHVLFIRLRHVSRDVGDVGRLGGGLGLLRHDVVLGTGEQGNDEKHGNSGL